MSRKRNLGLCAAVCREIVTDEVRKQGPLSVAEMYAQVQEVFPRTDYRVFASSLMARHSGLCIIDGVIDTLDRDTPRPTSRKERTAIKQHITERIMKKDGRAALRRVR